MYGWCLMENHLHLLVGQGKEELSVTMKRRYCNWKYKSNGYLFQDRYKSEKVDENVPKQFSRVGISKPC